MYIDCASLVLVNLIESKSSETLVNGLYPYWACVVHGKWPLYPYWACVVHGCDTEKMSVPSVQVRHEIRERGNGGERARRRYWAMSLIKVHDLHV